MRASSSAGPSDPFAGMPATQAATPSYQGGANDLLSDSLFGGLSTGKRLWRLPVLYEAFS